MTDSVGTAAAHREAHAISALANESGRPIDVVASVYRAELARLRQDAIIHDFLPVLAARRTREALLGDDVDAPTRLSHDDSAGAVQRQEA